MRHSSSLKWIYNKLREDYNIQTQGIHFFNILDLTWDPVGNMTPIGFYNQYRSLINMLNFALCFSVYDVEGEVCGNGCGKLWW